MFEAKQQGYEVAAFSGGEAFLYPWFEESLEDARDAGLARIAVTNATMLDRSRASFLHLLDFLAISVDGPEDIHNRIRRSPTAFARMLDGIEQIRTKGIRFGVAHTVTRWSLPHLDWMAEFALAQGASTLQLHPLALVGTAEGSLPGLDGEALARTYLAAVGLRRQFREHLQIHVDLFNLERLRHDPYLVIPRIPEEGAPHLLSQIINPLVIMSNGEISPVCHGMGSDYRLGSISHGLAACASRSRDRLIRLQLLCTELLSELLGSGSWPYVNWYELLEQRSNELRH